MTDWAHHADAEDGPTLCPVCGREFRSWYEAASHLLDQAREEREAGLPSRASERRRRAERGSR